MLIVPTGEREAPWNHYGRVVERGTVEDAFEDAGLLRWNVRLAPMTAIDPVTGMTVEASDRRATVRDMPNGGIKYLGNNGSRYCPVQNERMMELAEGLTDSSDLVVDTLGSYCNDRRVFVNFRMPEHIEVDGFVGGVDAFLFVASSHDGSLPLTAKVLLSRVACTNQLNSIFGSKTAPTVKLRHTSGVGPRLQDLREALGMSFKAVDTFSHTAQRWLDAEVTSDKFAEIMKTVFPFDKDSTKATVTRAMNRRDELEEVYLHSDTLFGLQNTAWGVVNAMVEWDDWARSARSDDARAFAMLEGRDSIKQNYATTVARVLDRADLLV